MSKHDVSGVFYQVSQAENTEGAGTVVEDGHVILHSGDEKPTNVGHQGKEQTQEAFDLTAPQCFSQFVGII